MYKGILTEFLEDCPFQGSKINAQDSAVTTLTQWLEQSPNPIYKHQNEAQ